MAKLDPRKTPRGEDAPVRDLIDQLAGLIDVLVVFFLALYATARPLIPPADAVGLGPNTLLQVFAATALLLWLLKANLQGGLSGTVCGAERPLIAWLGWVAFSGALAVERYRSAMQLGHWAVDAAAFWLAMQYARSAAGARMLLRVAFASAMIVAAYGIYQYAHGFEEMRRSPDAARWLANLPEGERAELQDRLASNRVFATFVIPNTLAAYLVLLLPAAAALVAVPGSGRRGQLARIAAAVVAATLLVAFLLTGSKGGALALCGGLAAGLYSVRRSLLAATSRAVHLAAAAGVALLLAGFVLTAYRAGPFAAVRDRLGDVFPTTTILWNTAQVRLGYWDAALRIAQDHPVRGVGPDHFRSYYHRYRALHATEVKHAHNDYLQQLAELGVVGLGLYLLLLTRVGAAVRRPADGPEADDDDGPMDPVTRSVLEFGPLFAVAAGACGFAFLYAMQVSFDAPQPEPGSKADYDAAFYLLAWMAWTACVVFVRPHPGPALRWGLGVGLMAYVLHGLVDFDLYVPQLASQAALLAGVACGLAARRRRVTAWRLSFPMVAQVVFGLILIPPFYLLTHAWLPRTIRFDNALARVQSETEKRTEGAAIPLLEEAVSTEQGVPWHIPTIHRLADIELRNFLRVGDLATYAANKDVFELPYNRLKLCQTLNPEIASLHLDEGRWLEHYAVLHMGEAEALGQGDPRYAGHVDLASKARRDATAAYGRAVACYPNHPAYRFALGRLLDVLEQPEARAELETARALHDSRPEGDRLRLNPSQVSELARRLAREPR